MCTTDESAARGGYLRPRCFSSPADTSFGNSTDPSPFGQDHPIILNASTQLPGKFLGQTRVHPEGSTSFPERQLPSALQTDSLLPHGATFQTQPVSVPNRSSQSRKSSEELALVCLQVLADHKNVRDDFYPTQKRTAQPSHIWREAATQRREERPPLAADSSGPGKI
jgi:hypothetical protein